MNYHNIMLALSLGGALALSACSPAEQKSTQTQTTVISEPASAPALVAGFEQRLDIYRIVDLTSDLSAVSAQHKEMLAKLIEAAEIMDQLFWKQAFSEDKQSFLAKITDAKTKAFADVNYGPWDRLQGDEAFLTGYTAKPLGAQFYPADMSKEEFEKADFADKNGLYSIVQRDKDGKLMAVPYSQVYKTELTAAAALLKEAAALSEDKDFANYLMMRADAFLNDNYQPSDFAWMAMKTNPIDLVIGPIETYEDQLFGYRAAFEAYVLVKDLAWSERLAKYAATLPALQKGLPVPEQYKTESPGSDADFDHALVEKLRRDQREQGRLRSEPPRLVEERRAHPARSGHGEGTRGRNFRTGCRPELRL